jgi:superfamily II DNA helicase RecQ
MELAHTLNHLQKFHCVVMDEMHLLLSDFRPIMKHLLSLWVMGCLLVTLTTSLSPYQETNLKIMMSTTFIIIQMSIVRLLIGYVIDEVVDVDDEIIRQFIKWDYNLSSKMDREIIYYFTRQYVEQVASIANNVACVKTIHLHAHLDEDTKKV